MSRDSGTLAPRPRDARFPPADQPDIVRAAQKDDFYKRMLNEQCYDLFSRIVGARISMNKQREMKLLSDACYYFLNTLMGTQTLGEEYCDILQVKYPSILPPTLRDRTLLIFWHVFLPYFFEKSCTRLYPLIPRVAPHLRDLLPKLQRLHLAFFYFSGRFYDFSKRMTNIRYIFNGKQDQQRAKYHILGVLILLQFGLSFLIFTKEKLGTLRQSTSQVADLSESPSCQDEPQNLSSLKCTLCLENRKQTTATLCGHLFCWSCITEWCNNKVPSFFTAQQTESFSKPKKETGTEL